MAHGSILHGKGTLSCVFCRTHGKATHNKEITEPGNPIIFFAVRLLRRTTKKLHNQETPILFSLSCVFYGAWQTVTP
jgi:hypothetical protein